MKKIVLLPVLLLVTKTVFAMPPLKQVLSPLAYKMKAAKILCATRGLQRGLPENLETFLQGMSSYKLQLENGTLDIPNALSKLDSSLVRFFGVNHVDLNPAAKFMWEFLAANDELVAHRVRRILKSYTTSLEPFEQPYAHEMEKVTEEEFGKRLNSLDSSKYQTMPIEEACLLADAIAKQLKNN